MFTKTVALVSLAFLAVACARAHQGAAAAPNASAEPAVSTTIAEMRGDLRACFEHGLARNPTLTGGFVAEVKVGAAGGVESVDAQDVEGLDRPVIACMTKRMQSARFPAPGEKGATVRIPLRFTA